MNFLLSPVVALIPNPFSALYNGLINVLASVLRFYGEHLQSLSPMEWGFAIIFLTFTVRTLMVPLAIKQTREMEKVQALSPKLQALQKRYKVDRSMMKTDPDRYRQIQERLREEQTKLYKENNANPVGSCLPALVQMPIFFALFAVLRTNSGPPVVPELMQAPFFGVHSLSEIGLAAGPGMIPMILIQGGAMFLTQKITMARQPQQMDGPAASMNKTMLYFMPVMLMFFSLSMPAGLVLYWVVSNTWTLLQSLFIFRFVSTHRPQKGGDDGDKYRPAKPGDKKK